MANKYNIEKIGDTYRVRRQVKGTRYCIPFDHKPTIAEIDLAFADKLTTLETGSKKSFKTCAEEYIKVNDGSLSPNTLKEYRGMLNRLPNTLLQCPVRDVTEPMVQKVVSDYAKQPGRNRQARSLKTVKCLRGFIIGILNKYGKRGFSINVVGAATDDDYMPTEQDIQRLLIFIKDTEIEIPVMISAFASLRMSELLALDPVEDVKNGMIHVNKTIYLENKEWKVKLYPKNETSIRYTPIPKELEKMIHEKGYIYKYKPNKLRLDFHKACEEAGIPKFRFHRLRAYYSSAAHAMGIPDKFIMKNGGWKTDSVLKKNYQRALADKQQAMDDKITAHFADMM